MARKLVKVFKNPYVFSIISKFCVVLAGFLFTVVQARYLGAELKGQVTYVTSITSITAIVLGLGMHQAYPYYKKKLQIKLLPVFFKIAMIQLAAYTVLAVVIAIIFAAPKLIAISLITPIMVYDKIVAYITMVEEPNRKNSIEMIVNFAELLLIIVLWIFFPASFLIGVAVIAFKDVIMAVIYTFHWRKDIISDKTPIRGWPLKLVKFGFFPMLALLMTTLNYRVDVIMLDGRVPDAAIGVYSIGVMLAERVWMIPDAMKEVMVSKVTKGKGTEEVAFVIRICNTVCLGVILGLIVLGQPFINIVFGEEYAGAYLVTLILLIGVFFMIYYKMIASYNIIIGKQVINFIFLGISVAGNLLANAIMIPFWGIYGAGAASVISYAICSILFIVQFRKTTKVPLRKMLFATPSDFKGLKSKLKKG